MTLCLLKSADGVIAVSTTCRAGLLTGTSVRFHNNGHTKVTVSKGRCKVCQKKKPALLVRKSMRGCILETGTHFAAKYTTSFSRDARLNV